MLELTGDALILVVRLTFVGLLYLFLGLVALAAAREARRLARAGAVERPSAQPAGVVVVDPGTTPFAAGERIALRPITRLGRAPDCTIVLDDTFVSGDHAVVFRRDGGWWIADRGSTNGTAVNDATIHGEAALRSGDVIGIGDVRLRLDA